MKKKIIIGLVFCLVLVGASFVYNFHLIDEGGVQMDKEELVFQGPVPEGYDQDHFRKTGETKLMEGIDG